MGGSYGGYLTAWIIAHDHRFAGAIVERGFLDPAAFPGSSDIGSFFGDEYVGTDPLLIAAQSPMAVVDRVRTPTLVLHSELDFRCPLEQATRYYAALKRGGVEAEMLVFPGEDHELTRAGRPRHRVQRFDAVLEWWGGTCRSGERDRGRMPWHPAPLLGLLRDLAELDRANDLEHAEHEQREADQQEQRHRAQQRREEQDDAGDDADDREEDRPGSGLRAVTDGGERDDALDDPQDADQGADEDAEPGRGGRQVREGEDPATMNSTPRTMWPMRAQPERQNRPIPMFTSPAMTT